jgi:hypothetical protein
MQSISGEAVLFALGLGGFLLCLLMLIAVLSMFRQRRAWKEHLADTRIRPPKGLSEAVKQAAAAPPTSPKMPVKPQPIPEHQRLPAREAAPDQVVIQIDPPEGPTRDQRNVQRLIAFLKDESKHDAKVS